MSAKFLGRITALTLVMLAAVEPVGAELVNSPWPKAGHDLRNTGRSKTHNGPISNTVKAKWARNMSADVKTSPVIGPDLTIYVGVGFNPICAVNPDGTLKWCTTGGGDAAYSSPAVGVDKDPFATNPGPVVYMGARDNKLWAVKDNGQGAWAIQFRYKNPLDGDIMASATIDPVTHAVYAACGCLSAGIVIAADPTPADMTDGPGELFWSYKTEKSIRVSAPALDDRQYLDPPTNATPNPFYRRIYIGSTDGTLHAFLPDSPTTTGIRKWKLKVGTTNRDSSAMIDDKGVIYIGSYAGLAAVKDKDDHGELAWPSLPNGRFVTDGYVSSAASVSQDGNTIYVGTSKPLGTLHAINAATGTEKWRVTGLPGAVYSQVAVSKDGYLYVVAGKYVFGYRDDGNHATKLWQYATGATIKWSSPAIGANGEIYIGSYDNKLHAIIDNPTP